VERVGAENVPLGLESRRHIHCAAEPVRGPIEEVSEHGRVIGSEEQPPRGKGKNPYGLASIEAPEPDKGSIPKHKSAVANSQRNHPPNGVDEALSNVLVVGQALHHRNCSIVERSAC
jgi:hypothetical protein